MGDTVFRDSSIFLIFFQIILRRYQDISFALSSCYKNSLIYNLTKSVSSAIKNNSKYSFLGRIAELETKNCFSIFENSISASFFIRLFLMAHFKSIELKYYLQTSIFVKFFKWIKNKLSMAPAEATGIFVISLIIANIFMTIIFNRRIELIGWVIRGIFLMFGLAGIFCKAGWKDLGKTAYVIKYIFDSSCKNQN